MPISRRYTPEKPPEESCLFGLDYSFVIPVGVGITSGEVHVWTNTVEPQLADTDFTIGEVQVLGRTIYAMLSGGQDGHDYQVRWKAIDTEANVWPRTCLLLVAQTS
jgi:hypothetical protein